MANNPLDDHKDDECYICLRSEVTRLHEENEHLRTLLADAEMARDMQHALNGGFEYPDQHGHVCVQCERAFDTLPLRWGGGWPVCSEECAKKMTDRLDAWLS